MKRSKLPQICYIHHSTMLKWICKTLTISIQYTELKHGLKQKSIKPGKTFHPRKSYYLQVILSLFYIRLATMHLKYKLIMWSYQISLTSLKCHLSLCPPPSPPPKWEDLLLVGGGGVNRWTTF